MKMSFLRIVGKVCFLAIALCPLACSDAGHHIDNFRKPGIWVTAIRDDVIVDSNKPCEVFILTEEEFKSYRERKEQDKKQLMENKPVGRTPFFYNNLKTGKYMVGIMTVLNIDKIGQSLEARDIIKIMAYDSHNEVTFSYNYKVKEGKLTVESIQITKWYKVNYDINSVYPIAALFLKKSDLLSEMEKYYPKNEQFIIKTSNKLLSEMFEKVQKEFPELSKHDKEKLLLLIKKGGKVSLAVENKYVVFYIDKNKDIAIKTKVVHHQQP